MKDQNGNTAETSHDMPHFNHSYHPVPVGYSITARSLSTKFREELKYNCNITLSNQITCILIEYFWFYCILLEMLRMKVMAD